MVVGGGGGGGEVVDVGAVLDLVGEVQIDELGATYCFFFLKRPLTMVTSFLISFMIA